MELIKLLEAIGTILIFVLVGIIASRLKLVKDKEAKVLTNIILYIAIPALTIAELPLSLKEISFSNLYFIPLMSLILTVILIYLSDGIYGILIPKGIDRDVFSMTVSFPNTIFIGLPLTLALYGSKALSIVFLYDLGATVVLYTLGIKALEKKGGSLGGILKNVINPPLIAMAVSFVIYFSGLQFPKVLMNSLSMMGNITIPLSLLVVGITIEGMKSDLKHIDFQVILSIFLKLFLVPVIMFGIVYFLDLDLLTKKVLILISAMPTMVIVSILSRTYNRNYQYASMVVFLTTLLSLITIPLIVQTIEYIF